MRRSAGLGFAVLLLGVVCYGVGTTDVGRGRPIVVASATRAPTPTLAAPPTPAPSLPIAAATKTGPATLAALSTLIVRRQDGGKVTLRVEVAATPQEQETGLTGRTRLDSDAGMLFVFPSDAPIEFWMRGTSIPLSLAFVRSDGTIVDLQDMQPLSEDRHAPPQPIRYAIEVNRGFFQSHGIKVGDRVDLPST